MLRYRGHGVQSVAAGGVAGALARLWHDRAPQGDEALGAARAWAAEQLPRVATALETTDGMDALRGAIRDETARRARQGLVEVQDRRRVQGRLAKKRRTPNRLEVVRAAATRDARERGVHEQQIVVDPGHLVNLHITRAMGLTWKKAGIVCSRIRRIFVRRI